jgi:hypothetical protein
MDVVPAEPVEGGMKTAGRVLRRKVCRVGTRRIISQPTVRASARLAASGVVCLDTPHYIGQFPRWRWRCASHPGSADRGARSNPMKVHR